jgi:hypothetical protein
MRIEFTPFHQYAKEIILASKRHEKKEGEVDWEGYLEESKRGECVIATMWNDNVLIGYNIFLLQNNPHNRLQTEAQNVAFWVDPQYRGANSVRLMRQSHNEIKNIGINKIFYVMDDPRIGKLLERSGFHPTHTVWELKDNE